MKRYVPFILGFVLLAGSVMGGMHQVGAQVAPTQILVNWQAATYTPPDFGGKALPTIDSRITAGVDLIDQGKHVNLSTQKVFWYLNDEFYQGGVGAVRVTFNAPHFVGNTSVKLRVSIPDYGSGPTKEVTIPIVPPEITLRTSASSLNAAATPFSLQAYPYFFNVQSASELQYLWTLRGALLSNQNPIIVTRQMTQGGNNALLEVQAINPSREIERLTKSITLFPQ